MTVGPPNKVLPEVAAEIRAIPSGEITLVWHTAHQRRVVEVLATTIRLESEPADDSPAEAAEQPVKAVRKKPAAEKERRSAGRVVLDSWLDAWRTVFPPRDER